MIGKSYTDSSHKLKSEFRRKIGRCEICAGLEKLVVDHDHKTGAIRGVLCDRCNSWLGIIERDLMRGVEYRIKRLEKKLDRYGLAVDVFLRFLKERNPGGFKFKWNY